MEIHRSFNIRDRLEELTNNLDELETAHFRGEQVVELSTVDFVSPLSILPLTVQANLWDMKINCTEQNTDIRRYLKTIGFQQGVTTLSSSDKRYLPIARLSFAEDHVITKYENNILASLGGGRDMDCINLLTDELIGNVEEHAEVDHFWILAQYYQKRRTCELVIVDTGVGYKKSYEGTEFEVNTDAEAIYNALEGRSSKSTIEDKVVRGQGIPTISRIYTEGYGGKLIILSGTSMVYRKQNETKEIALRSNYLGSVVCINYKFDATRQVDYREYF